MIHSITAIYLRALQIIVLLLWRGLISLLILEEIFLILHYRMFHLASQLHFSFLFSDLALKYFVAPFISRFCICFHFEALNLYCSFFFRLIEDYCHCFFWDFSRICFEKRIWMGLLLWQNIDSFDYLSLIRFTIPILNFAYHWSFLFSLFFYYWFLWKLSEKLIGVFLLFDFFI